MHIQRVTKAVLSLLLFFSCSSIYAGLGFDKSSYSDNESDHLTFLAVPVKDFKGENRSLAEFANQGKWQVVMLWSSLCDVSNREMHQYVNFYEKNKSSDISFIGISLDGIENRQLSRDFVEKHAMNFTNLLGDYETLSRYFLSDTGESSFSTPSFLLYSPSGELMASQVGAMPPELISNFIQNEKIIMNRKISFDPDH